MLPRVHVGQHSVQEDFELLEKLRLAHTRATLHGPHWSNVVALRPLLAEGAKDVLACLLVHAPAERAVALDTLVASIWHALGHVEGTVAAVLQEENDISTAGGGEGGWEKGNGYRTYALLLPIRPAVGFAFALVVSRLCLGIQNCERKAH